MHNGVWNINSCEQRNLHLNTICNYNHFLAAIFYSTTYSPRVQELHLFLAACMDVLEWLNLQIVYILSDIQSYVSHFLQTLMSAVIVVGVLILIRDV